MYHTRLGRCVQLFIAYVSYVGLSVMGAVGTTHIKLGKKKPS